VRRLGRIVLRVLLALAILLVLAGVTGVLIIRSDRFHEYIRRTIVEKIEQATGGRVELGSFSFSASALTAQVDRLVLHGKESSNEPPLARVESVKIGLRILSVMERKVDLASVSVVRPQVRIVFYPNGTNNLPSPAHPGGGKVWSEELLNLKVRQYDIHDGLMEYDDRKIPLDLRGDGLEIRMTYDARKPAYSGELAIREVRGVIPGELKPLQAGVSATFSMETTRVVFSRLRIAMPDARVDLTGELQNLREPRGRFTVKATAAVREVTKMFPILLEPAGTAAFDGRLTVAFGHAFDIEIAGHVNGRGLGFSRDRLKIEGADFQANVNLRPTRLTVSGIEASALGASFTGAGTLADWRRLHVEGKVDGLTVARAASIATDRPMPWNGTLAGDVSVDTSIVDSTIDEPDTQARANLSISPASEGTAIEGRVDAIYDQKADQVFLGNSYLATPATRLDVAGTLGTKLQVRFRSSNLDDLLPALALAEKSAPTEIPLKLMNGTASADGTILGTLENPRFQGAAAVTNGSVQGHGFDKFNATLDVTEGTITASSFTISRAMTEANGSATVAAGNGSFDDATVTAQVNLRNARLNELAKEAGSTLEVMGTASAAVRVSGSVREPQAAITLDVQQPSALGEHAGRLRANIDVSRKSLQISNGVAEDGSSRVQFSGNYQPSGNDWKAGDVQFQAATQNLVASRVEAIAAIQPPLEARLTVDLRGRGRVSNGAFALTSATGSASAQAVTVDHQPVGDVALTAETNGADVSVGAKGKLEDAAFEGQGSWRLEGDQPGTASVRFARMNLASVNRLMMLGGTAEEQKSELPFEGFVEGRATISGPLRRLRDFQAELTLDTVQINGKSTQATQLGVQPSDLVLKNRQPVVVAISSQEARIRSAQFTGRDTNIEATGTVPLASGSANVSVKGTVNLVILQLLNPDLQIAQGNATVEATVRGALRDPMVNGSMELKDASLFLKDLPNGVDKAKGVIVFDRNRATIQQLTAETGGGTVSFSGFLEFGAPLLYRLHANFQQVRLRLPNELSITSNANFDLNGTSDASTLSGTVSLTRASFNPQTDLFKLLAASSKPVPTASPNEYLRGIQFDVRVDNDPNFQFQTSLTRDVQAEVALRLRGSILRPVLLGTVSVDSGEVELLGNNYTIDRGDIRFQNPVKIEPTFDINLETKAKGVTVNISLSGTMDKVKPNYSSDPPLQSSEIIALLAVGRDPTQSSGLASAQSSANSASYLEAGGGLLSQAVSAQLSSKLQRFFGASRVKIDPTMTGLSTTPQAMLTFEQQVSKEITLTYITNLNYTAEQIVRLEWDFNRNWSAIAVRDSNGLFGIDFQYRKRFK
jgi:translocation and assembly module TamB